MTWKKRYANEDRLVPMPKSFDQHLRHMNEHGWHTKGSLDTHNTQQREFLEDNIHRFHDVAHQWYDSYEEADEYDPSAWFHRKDDSRSYNPDHEHSHPDSGKPITGVTRSYTDD